MSAIGDFTASLKALISVGLIVQQPRSGLSSTEKCCNNLVKVV